MHIAVVGAGLAGLGVGWHLLQWGANVTFFDEKGVGQGTSGVATGLLHPYVGEKARRSWRASEGLAHTEELIAICEQVLGRSVCVQRGPLRMALDEEQQSALMQAAVEYGDVQQIGDREFILRSGITVDVPMYLEGLFRACQKLGAIYEQKKVFLDEAVDGFDQTIFACGSDFLTSSFSKNFSLKPMKGQILMVECSEPFERSRIAKGYLAATFQPHIACLGATYEREYQDDQICLRTATSQLLPRMPLLLPSSSCTWQIIGGRAGIRLMRRGSYIPYIQELGGKCWWIGAFGSRGLLYHAYLGKKLAQALFEGSVILPKEV